MRRVTRSPFDEDLEDALRKDRRVAKAYARMFAEFPLSTQLAIIRRRRWLSQRDLARSLKVKQPQVARLENGRHDPRLSSLSSQARALHCRLLVVPDELMVKIAQIVATAGRAR